MTLFLGARWFHDLLHGSMVHTCHDSLLHVSCFVICIFQAKNDPFLASCHLTISPFFSPKPPESHRRWNAKTVGKHAALPPWDCDKNEGKGCKFVNGWTPRIVHIFQILPAWRDHHFWSTQGPKWFQICVLMATLSPTNYGSSEKIGPEPNKTRYIVTQDSANSLFFHWTMTLEGFWAQIRVLLWVWRQTMSISPRKKLKWTWETLRSTLPPRNTVLLTHPKLWFHNNVPANGCS